MFARFSFEKGGREGAKHSQIEMLQLPTGSEVFKNKEFKKKHLIL